MRRRGVVVALLAACAEPPASTGSGTLEGQVVMSGPLRNARVVASQLYMDRAEFAVREVAGEVLATEGNGHFVIDTGNLSGVFLLETHGGEFDDLITGETIVLDDSEGLRTLQTLDLLGERDDVLVSPIGHLTEALVRYELRPDTETIFPVPPSGVREALDTVEAHLHPHFGDVDWQRVQPASLTTPATSPTEALRAAFVLGGLSMLAADVAQAASASPQEVNVLSLTKGWAEDLANVDRGQGVFDGNDANARELGTGVQVGACPPVDAACVVSSAACNLGDCRVLCDVYAGMPRSLLAGAMTKLIRSPWNQTGLDDADTLGVARAIADNQDPILFGSSCRENLDRLPPSISFENAPANGAFVRGTLAIEVRAIDDYDPNPVVTFASFPDADGDPTNAVARAMIDLTAMGDGDLVVEASAVDLSGNVGRATRSLVVDTTPPALTLSPAGFVEGTVDEWWTGHASPTLTGTVADANGAAVTLTRNGTVVAEATVAGDTWSATLPTGTLDLDGEPLVVRATDPAGNTVEINRLLRYDGTAPSIDAIPRENWDHRRDVVTFPNHRPSHSHLSDPSKVLGPSANCVLGDGDETAAVYKYGYLLGVNPAAFVVESVRDRLLWTFDVRDDGIGYRVADAQYRVRRAGAAAPLVEWRMMGTGVAYAGGWRFDLPLHHRGETGNLAPIPDLATVEDVYQVDVRVTDLLGRQTTFTRCWEHHPLAPPLEVGAVRAASNGGAGSGKYALAGWTLADPADPIGNYLLAEDSRGVGLIEFEVSNGTNETIYATFDLLNPTGVTFTKTTRVGWARTTYATALTCPAANPGPCARVVFPVEPPPDPSGPVSSAATRYGVRVFENGQTEIIPCPTCIDRSSPTNTKVSVALPPATTQPRQFVVMATIGPVHELRPGEYGPFRDAVLNWVTPEGLRSLLIAGRVGEAQLSGCPIDPQLNPGGATVSCGVSTWTKYRALEEASLTFVNPVRVEIRTAPGASGVAVRPPFLVPIDRSARPTPWNAGVEVGLP